MLGWFLNPSDGLANLLEDWSDWLLVLFTSSVLVGVISEYLAEFKRVGWFHDRVLIWAIVIVVGLAGEMFTEFGSFWYALKLQSSEADKIKGLDKTAHDAHDAAKLALSDADAAEGMASDAVANASNAQAQIIPLKGEERRLHNNQAADEAALSPRILTKRQYEAIASLNGKVSTVNFAVESQCFGCIAFAVQLQRPLSGVHIPFRQFFLAPEERISGMTLVVTPVGEANPSANPVCVALKAADLHPSCGKFPFSYAAEVPPTNVPLIVVGEAAPFPGRPWYVPKSKK